MTYEKWLTLTDEEQTNTPDEELPTIPAELLTNNLIEAKMMRRNGELGWETTQTVTDGRNTRWFPVYRMKMVSGEKFWYKFQPTSGLYSLNLTEGEPTTEEEPIGTYGMRWMEFMEREHPHLVTEMQFHHKYLTVARSVDKAAWEYRTLLDEQFAKENPRPEDFEETLRWEEARKFFSDSTVMRERILMPVTEP